VTKKHLLEESLYCKELPPHYSPDAPDSDSDY
jgi:hypothetical protein